MSTIRSLKQRFSTSTSKATFEYETYSYEYLRSKRLIVFEGFLNFFLEKNFLLEAIFRKYFVVLSRIEFRGFSDMFGIYIYEREKRTVPLRFLELSSTIEIVDRCPSSLKPSINGFFFEILLKNEKSTSYVFGAEDHLTRKSWIDTLRNLSSQSKCLTNDSDETNAYLRPKELPIDRKTSFSTLTKPLDGYQEFRTDYNSLPIGKVETDDTYEIHEKLSRSQPIVTSANTQSYSVVEPHLDPEVLQTNRIRPNWTLNDIFYANERDDYIKILSRTSVSGTFLIRPQSKKSSGNDHDYTLCVVMNDKIHSFPIYQTKNLPIEFSLMQSRGPRFSDLVQLSLHYAKYSLPQITRDSTTIRLTRPFSK